MNKSTQNHSFININQFQAHTFKKNKDHQKNYQRDYIATMVNTIKVMKKEKDKINDLSHIEY